MNTVIVLAAKPGNGKSHFANYLSTLYPSAVVCCADDWFTGSDGVYQFDKNQLGAAHSACKEKFSDALERGQKLIVVANTNVNFKDRNYYLDAGRAAGYQVFSLALENLGFENQHGVNAATVERMVNSLKQNFRF